MEQFHDFPEGCLRESLYRYRDNTSKLPYDSLRYKYEFWLHSINDLSCRLKTKLYSCFPTAEEIYGAKEKELRSLGFLPEDKIAILVRGQKCHNFQKDFESLEDMGVKFIPWNSPRYPSCLLEMPDYPHGIFVKGSLPDPNKISIGIVGARKCTSYGEHYALEYGKFLSQMGFQIVSGLARGIDGCGHRGALIAGKPTFAVLGSGVDICYPKENMGLYQDILTIGGGIISEFMPGTEPLPFHFPMRNRIISGLSQVLLIIEAKEKSGSLITADIALELGRDIYALPGAVNNRYSKGCHYLIKQGAGILISPEELLKDLGILTGKSSVKGKENQESCRDNNKIILDNLQNMVYSLMCFNPKSINRLVEETDLMANKVIDALVRLELDGLIKEVSKNYYVRL
jgi:DNA processing protein